MGSESTRVNDDFSPFSLEILPRFHEGVFHDGVVPSTRGMRRLCVAASKSRTTATCQGTRWSEVFLNTSAASKARSAGEAVEQGHSVVLLHGLASRSECAGLRLEASGVAVEQRRGEDIPFARTNQNAASGRVRMKADHMLGGEGSALCNDLFHRAIGIVEDEPELRRITAALAALTLDRSFFDNDRLCFTGGEPAINIYTSGGEFHPQ